MWGEFCNVYSPNAEESRKEVTYSYDKKLDTLTITNWSNSIHYLTKEEMQILNMLIAKLDNKSS